ncbi:MAG: hypothetical protein LBI68_06545 [Azoarcus sp.]|nr:hypothetical protein [Azoarcus sp.]
MQWISWEKFGTALVTRKDDTLYMDARQELDGKYITAQGTIRIVNAREFILKGEIVMKADHFNDRQLCERKGEFHFKPWGHADIGECRKVSILAMA